MPLGGAIWILGGLDASGASTAAVLRVDQATGTVSAAGPLPFATHDAAAAWIGSSAYVFGGGQAGSSDWVQAFTPGQGAKLVGHLPHARSDLSAVAGKGGALLAGGYDGALAAMEVIETRDGTAFSPVARLTLPVRYAATVAVQGKLYLFGGSWDGVPRRAVQVVDLAAGTSRVVAMLPVALSDASAVVLAGAVWILGGRTPSGPTAAILRFDPESGLVTAGGSLPAAVADAAAVSYGGAGYLVGGETAASTTAGVVRLTAS